MEKPRRAVSRERYEREGVVRGQPRVELGDVPETQRLLPWSEAVPESCRMTPAETTSPDPMGVPVIDVDPHTLDEE